MMLPQPWIRLLERSVPLRQLHLSSSHSRVLILSSVAYSFLPSLPSNLRFLHLSLRRMPPWLPYSCEERLTLSHRTTCLRSLFLVAPLRYMSLSGVSWACGCTVWRTCWDLTMGSVRVRVLLQAEEQSVERSPLYTRRSVMGELGRFWRGCLTYKRSCTWINLFLNFNLLVFLVWISSPDKMSSFSTSSTYLFDCSLFFFCSSFSFQISWFSST